MTRWKLSAVSAMALIAAASGAAIGQQPTGPVGTVVGQVVVGESKTPIQGAQVLVLGSILRPATKWSMR